MKKFNKPWLIALIAVLAVAVSMTACKQWAGGAANPVPKFTKSLNGNDFILNGSNGISFKMKKISAVTNGTIGRSDQSDNEEYKVTLS